MPVQYQEFATASLSGLHALIFMYGSNGSGKTRFCATMPDPLFIATETGINGLIVRKNPGKFVTISKFDELFQVFNDLEAKKVTCGSIIIDTFSQITGLVMDAVTAETGKPVSKYSQYEWAMSKDKVRMVLSKLLDFQKTHHICVTAQAIQKEKEGVNGSDYFGPDTLGNFRELAPGYFDWYLYSESMTVANKTEWVLHSVKRGNWPARDRLGILAPKEPNDFSVLEKKLIAATQGVTA